MSFQNRQSFWREALALQGSITPNVLYRVLLFGILAAGICGAAGFFEEQFLTRFQLDVTAFELAGAALGVLLVFRTNAGYERWWEARKLWGGLVDRSRNFAIGAVAYGPRDAPWREQVLRWVACYPHVVRHTLRRERPSAAVINLLGRETAERIAAAQHMPAFVALQLAGLLRDACERLGMDRFAFLQIDRERTLLVDSVGGCERILNTPMPRAYSLKIRHFLTLFLLILPLTLRHRFDTDWLVPLVTMLVAYPLLSLDQLGVELENPFVTENLSHLPLDEISATIERNVLGLLKKSDPPAPEEK
ncbi:MAG TPA: bestrophin family ion channel [Candidatus Anammoximicrobium sp.]|nr:bestrophin family ion channel [Candidatus Anammoximicrobium sp.]